MSTIYLLELWNISIEEDVFANEFCKIAHIKPGAEIQKGDSINLNNTSF